MKRNWIRIALSGSLVLILVACNSSVTPTLPENTAFPITVAEQTVVAQTGTASLIEEDMQMTPSIPAPESTGMQNLVEKAKEDLAQRLSISANQIDLIEAKAVTWPDASLGCPQPGMSYIQVPQDGALIVLQAEGSTYEYHNGGSRGLFLCEKRFLKTEISPQIDITDLTPDNTIPPGEDQ